LVIIHPYHWSTEWGEGQCAEFVACRMQLSCRLPYMYNLYCYGVDVKPCSINQSTIPCRICICRSNGFSTGISGKNSGFWDCLLHRDGFAHGVHLQDNL